MITTRGHIPTFRQIPGIEIAAICDTNLPRAQAAAAEFGIPAAFDDYKAMIAQTKLDAVSVGVPNVFHAPATIAALEAGLHVLCEKPLATSVADGEAMVEAAKRNGRVLAINMSQRPRPEVGFLREQVAAGSLGRIHYANGRLLRRSGIPGFGSWFTRRELSGGGALMDIGVHVLDMMLWILGFPKVAAVRGEVQANLGPQERGLGGWGIDRVKGGTFDVDDLAAIHLRLADGGLVTVEVTWAYYGRDEERIQIAGDQGGADYFPDLYGTTQPLRMYRHDGETSVEVIPSLPRIEGAWAQGLVRFVDACQGKGEALATGEEALKILRLLDATNRSAAEKREITL
jgi:predicted dehydrogenase